MKTRMSAPHGSPPRNIGKRLLRLERRLAALEAEEARPEERLEYADGEIVEIALGLLACVFEGDMERYAEYLVKYHGLPLREAEELAGDVGRILAWRRVGGESRTPRVGASWSMPGTPATTSTWTQYAWRMRAPPEVAIWQMPPLLRYGIDRYTLLALKRWGRISAEDLDRAHVMGHGLPIKDDVA